MSFSGKKNNKLNFIGFMKRRSTAYGANITLSILVAISILVLLQLISLSHPFKYDLTANKKYSLAPQSKKLLKSLDKEVKAIFFYQHGSSQLNRVEEQLKLYAFNSRNFKYQLVDVDRNPKQAEKYGIKRYDTLILECEDRRESLYQINESKITNVIARITQEKKNIVYFLSGHGEKGIEDTGINGLSSLKEVMESENYISRQLFLIRKDRIPQDAQVVIIAAPQKKLFPVEIEALSRYLQQGGRLVVLIEYNYSEIMANFLKKYGFVLGKGVIVDKFSRLFGGDYLTPIATSFGDHPITRELASMAPFFPIACSVEAKGIPEKDIQATSLLKSAPGSASWEESDTDTLFSEKKATFDPSQDKVGPISIASAVTIKVKKPSEKDNKETQDKQEKKEEPEKTSRIVVFGDSDFITNQYLHLSGNKDLFMNSINWLAEREDLIAIRPQEPSKHPLLVSGKQMSLIFFLAIIFLPGLVIVTGITVCFRRG